MNFPYLSETEDLTDAVRVKAGGSFIRLPDGVCHYEITQHATRNTPTIVLLHGFSVPYFIWDPTFAFLSASGFRVLRFDLFGRGLSDRPRTSYNIDLFVHQLRDLLDALKISEPINLFGLSMGGPISVAFTERFPARVEKLVLIDPAGAKPIALSPMLKLAKIPILSNLAFGLAGDESLLKSIASDFYDPTLVAEFIDRYRPQMKFKGFKRAILSSLRNNMLGDFYESYRRVGKLRKPTLLLWGRNDGTVPFEHSDLVRAAIPHAEFHVIEGVGHIPHYEKPEEVNPILLKFLTQKSLP
jgi:pimeloyl-ACP methyl ester carboxylesterase